MKRIALLFLIAGCQSAPRSRATTSIRELTADERSGLKSWREGCPVSPAELVSVQVPSGNFLVHRLVAQEVSDVLAEALAAGFVIERAQPIEAYGGSDDASMEANNSSAFNCRPITVSVAPGQPAPPPRFSTHSCGIAIDLNPLWNPYVKPKDLDAFLAWEAQQPPGPRSSALDAYCSLEVARCVVLPPAAIGAPKNPHGVIDSVVVKAFTRRGWTWGGSWPATREERVRRDVQHFEKRLPGFCE